MTETIETDSPFRYRSGTTKRRPTWSATIANLNMSVWRGPWPAGDIAAFYESRKIFFSIADRGNVLAGGEFEEWGWGFDGDKWRLPDLRSFVEATDDHSIAAFQMASAVRAGWRSAERQTSETPLHYGNIVVFDRLRIELSVAAQSPTIWQLIELVIDREFRHPRRPREPASMVVLKAFPLEFEGKDTRQSSGEFERRLAAMIRLYGRRLAARPFGGKGVELGWLWIDLQQLSGGCQPTARKGTQAAGKRGRQNRPKGVRVTL